MEASTPTDAGPDDRGEVMDLAGLRSIYRDPSDLVLNKTIDHVDVTVEGFIARSPLFVLATSDGTATDASPRGGPPGFVRVLDRHRIAFGDLTGNNRLDSYANLVAHPAVGMLFMVPGLEETLRVNGRARMRTDEALRATCALDDRVPKAVVEIEVDECFLHCGAALRRAAVWDLSTWPEAGQRPSPGAMIVAHTGIDVEPEAVEANMNDYYDNGIWEVGGQSR